MLLARLPGSPSVASTTPRASPSGRGSETCLDVQRHPRAFSTCSVPRPWCSFAGLLPDSSSFPLEGLYRSLFSFFFLFKKGAHRLGQRGPRLSLSCQGGEWQWARRGRGERLLREPAILGNEAGEGPPAPYPKQDLLN